MPCQYRIFTSILSQAHVSYIAFPSTHCPHGLPFPTFPSTLSKHQVTNDTERWPGKYASPQHSRRAAGRRSSVNKNDFHPLRLVLSYAAILFDRAHVPLRNLLQMRLCSVNLYKIFSTKSGNGRGPPANPPQTYPTSLKPQAPEVGKVIGSFWDRDGQLPILQR